MTQPTPELPALPDLCWPVDSSCANGWDEATDPERERAAALAVQSLRMLTGYRVGGCPVTVRPATRFCRARTWATYPAGGMGEAAWAPVSLGGQWLNIGCAHGGASPCSCLATREVRLNGPAASIVEVVIDGMVLDPSAYRLDAGGRLVRLDGEGWPLCQDLALPAGDPGTWTITYQPGIVPDGLAAYAAGVLAGEFLRLCGGGDCALPATVQQVVRQGVTLTLAPGIFPGGLTGIREVDAWVARYNPHRLAAPSAVWSPDLHRARRSST